MRLLKQIASALVIIALAGAGFWYFGTAQKTQAGKADKEQDEAKRGAKGQFEPTKSQWANLSVKKVESRPFHSELVTDGKIAIDEDRTTPVFSPYSGVIKRLVVKTGDHIDAGQLLFTIEATDMVQAQNDFIVALDALKASEAQLQMAQITERRQKSLFDAKATAQKDWQQAQSDLVTSESTKRTAEIALEAVRNRLRILKKTDAEVADFQKSGTINPETPIYAPIAGSIVQRKVGPGQYITSGASDPTGDPVFVIGDLSTVWLVANVRETDALEIHRGQMADFKVLSGRDRVFTTKINYVAEIMDPSTRRLLVRATVENADKLLKPEMFARVTIRTSDDQVSPGVPREAVIYEGDAARVWAVAMGGKALELRRIKTGLVNGNLVQVLEGLGPNDQIVTSGALFIDRAANGGEAG